jgi:hypothetical protein
VRGRKCVSRKQQGCCPISDVNIEKLEIDPQRASWSFEAKKGAWNLNLKKNANYGSHDNEDIENERCARRNKDSIPILGGCLSSPKDLENRIESVST